MNLISVDFGKYKTGVFCKKSGKEDSMLIRNKPRASMEESLSVIYHDLKKIIELSQPDFGIMEGYGFNEKHKSSRIPMAEIGGVIKLLFYQLDIPVIVMPIQTWKTLTVGMVDKKKDEDLYRSIVKQKYGKEFQSLDETDAFLFYQSLKIISLGECRLTKSMKRIRSKLSEIIDSHKLLKKGA